jgi:dTMP kinase
VFIVFEGIDGSGKQTQTQLLYEFMKDTRKTVSAPLSFPRYKETFFGGQVRRYLNGEFGQLGEVHPFLASLLYAMDRFQSHDLINASKYLPGYHLADRYVYSNIAHQGAAVADPEERAELITAIKQVEFEIFRLPHADLVFLLDIPAGVSMMRTAGKPTDIHEANLEYQKRVREIYLQLANALPSWHVISCIDGTGSRTSRDIHDEIRGIVFNQHGFKEDYADVGAQTT